MRVIAVATVSQVCQPPVYGAVSSEVADTPSTLKWNEPPGPLQATREALPLFGPEGGSVINISSIVSRMGIPGSAVYAGTKGALDTITQVLASELGPRKIRVNSINPGMVESEGTHTAGFIGSDFQKNVEAQAPLGRIGQPEDVAKVAVFLASDESSWLTGERISASGGHR